MEVRIKHLIDRIHIERPARGSQGIRDDINNMKLGFRANCKRISATCGKLVLIVVNAIKRIYVYPYLLRYVRHQYPNHMGVPT
jgi:hypothetical protein